MDKAELKILMLGARRVGKTSLLAAIVNSFEDANLKKHLIIEDVTPDKKAQNTLKDKIESFKNFLSTYEGKIVLNQEDSTIAFHDYVINVKLPNENGDMKMIFTDANGEFYVQGGTEDHQSKDFEDVLKKMDNYDIIIVAIDTPYLMEAVNESNEFCDEVLNEMYNQTSSIHSLLSNVHDEEGKNPKLVIFTPVKCELWAKIGEIDEVTKRVEQVYDTTLMGLKAHKNIEVVILPVQTIGNIIFNSHKEAFQVTFHNNVTLPCSNVDGNGYVLLSNGDKYKLTTLDNHQPDYKSIIEGYEGFQRPGSWFKVISSVYDPHNCEQLAYYILQFLLSKTLNAKKIEEAKKKKGRWWKGLLAGVVAVAGHVFVAAAMAAYWYLSERFGSINIEKLQKALDEIKKRGLWKQNVDGIKIINKGLLEN